VRPAARILAVVLLLCVAAGAALWVLPARWVMAWIPANSPVVVVDASGSIWAAKAQLAVGVPGLRRTVPGLAQWRLQFDPAPVLVVQHAWLRGPVALSATWRGVRLTGQSLQLPASVLTTLHPLFNTLDPGGALSIEWPDLLLRGGGGAVPAQGGSRLLTARWQQASSSLSRIRPFGDYTLAADQIDEGALQFTVQTERGPLLIEGRGRLPRGGRLSFDGRARADASSGPDVRAALRGVLDVLGPGAGETGEVALRLR